MKAAIYTRVSTEDQRDNTSLEAQERMGRDRAEADGAESVEVFQDVLSGGRNDRPDYVRLLAAAAEGGFDTVYVWAWSRFGREADERIRARKMLGATGVRLVSLTEGDDPLMHDLRAVLDEEEKRKLAERTAMGLREVGSSGRWRGGTPPLGYRLVEGKLVVVPAEAAVVRRVFAMYLSGMGQNRIAAALNSDGITTRRGARFSPRVIIETLQNRAYIGEIGSRDETLCADAHKPIIDREMWDRAQRLRASRTHRPNGGRGRPAKRHLLDGLLVCPNGHRMLARRNANGWEHYRCCDRHSGGTCPTPAVGRKKVDEMVLAHFLGRHFSEDDERERLRAAAGEKSAEARSLADEADREEREAEASLVRIRRDYRRGAITAEQWQEFEAELAEEAVASRNRAQQLRARAAQIEAEAEEMDTEAELVRRLAAILKAAAGKANDPDGIAEMRAALAATFESIVFEPCLPAWDSVPEGSPLLIGATQLVPVLRADLAPKPCSHAGSRKASVGNECAAGSPPPS